MRSIARQREAVMLCHGTATMLHVRDHMCMPWHVSADSDAGHDTAILLQGQSENVQAQLVAWKRALVAGYSRLDVYVGNYMCMTYLSVFALSRRCELVAGAVRGRASTAR